MTLTLPYWSHASRRPIHGILYVMVPLNAWRELLFLLINLTILQNEDYCLSHRSRRGHLMTNVI